MNPESPGQPICSQLSRQLDEPLIATTTPTNLYLLLQNQEVWGRKAFEESSLPETVKDRLRSFTKTNSNSKLLMIRTGKSRTNARRQALATSSLPADRGNKIAFFAALSEEGQNKLFHLPLDSYLQLLELDLENFLSGGEKYSAYLTEQQLALVCTNGKRDLCCARYGAEVYNRLIKDSHKWRGILIWQSTHMGGHRFAANLLWLPYGVLYGRVNPSNAAEIIAAQQQGKVYLPNLRGRTAYPQPAQAAEFFLRKRLEESRLDTYRLHEIQEMGIDRWRVEFTDTRSGTIERVNVDLEVLEDEVYESCTLDKKTRIKYYRLTE